MRQLVPFAFESESRLADHVLGQLSAWFVVDREVWGTHCSGKRLRMDAVIRPRDPSGWKEPDCAFGVEFKIPKGSDTKDYTQWAAQSVDYTHTEWDGYGRLLVFLCPSFSEQLGSFRDPAAASIIMNLLGQLGVGEIARSRHYGLTLTMHSHHRLWSELDGVRAGRHWGLRPKAGSR